MKFILKNYFFIIFISILLYILYRSEIIHKGDLRNYYYPLFFLSGIFLFLHFSYLFCNNEIKKKVSLVFFSVIFIFYLLEIFLIYNLSINSTVIDLEEKKKIFEKETSLKFDDRDKVEIYLDMKDEQEDVILEINPVNHINQSDNFLPLSSISNKLTIDCNENGYYNIYQSDRYGFNNDDRIWDLDTIDVVVIGDSFVQGACVFRENNIANNIKKAALKDKHINVLNLGQGGNGPLLEYATFIEYFPNDKKTKVLLWFIYENDLVNLKTEIKDQFLLKYLLDDFKQNLLTRQNDVDNYLNKKFQFILKEKIKQNALLKYNKKEKENLLFNFIKLKNLRFTIIRIKDEINNKKNSNINIEIYENFKSILKKVENKLQKNKTKLVVVYLPSFQRYEKKYKGDLYNYEKLIKVINDNNFNLIDLKKDMFDNLEDPKEMFPFKSGGHYNVSGYEEVSKFVYDKIADVLK